MAASEGGGQGTSAGLRVQRELQARAAKEPARLPEGSAVLEMLNNYSVMRQQARVS